MPPSFPPDPAVLDWLDARLDVLDEAPLIAALSDAEVAAELRELGLDASELRRLPEVDRAVPPQAMPTSPRLDRLPERHRVARPAAPPALRRARWRTSVLAAAGLLALVVASTLVLRPSGDGATAPGAAMESGEMKSSVPSPAPTVADAAPASSAAPTPAEQTAQQIARLRAFTSDASTGVARAASRDTAGVAAAISDVRRAYDDAAAFEAVSGRPVDPSLSAGLLAALLRDAYAALGDADSARAFARRITP